MPAPRITGEIYAEIPRIGPVYGFFDIGIDPVSRRPFAAFDINRAGIPVYGE